MDQGEKAKIQAVGEPYEILVVNISAIFPPPAILPYSTNVTFRFGFYYE